MSSASANLNPGTLYEAYIDLPADASAAEREERYLGTFSFFGATDGHAHGGHGPNFDITERIVDLRARDLLSAETQVTIVPLASVADGAEPVVGSIDLVRQ